MKELLKSKFFSFFAPYIGVIDSGKLFRRPFAWLYIIFGVICALIPLYLIYSALNSGGIKFEGILIILVHLFVGWFGLQFWFNRSCKVAELTSEDAEFVSTPVFSHLIQSLGEWLGTYVAVVGFFTALIQMISSGKFAELGNFGHGWIGLAVATVGGFLIIVISRFIAEMFRALTSIANNTAKK